MYYFDINFFIFLIFNIFFKQRHKQRKIFKILKYKMKSIRLFISYVYNYSYKSQKMSKKIQFRFFIFKKNYENHTI